MAKSKNLCLQSGATSEPISQTGEESQHSLCKLSFLPFKFNRLNANTVFGRECVQERQTCSVGRR